MTSKEKDYKLESFKTPKSIPLKTIAECLEAVEELNKDSKESGNK